MSVIRTVVKGYSVFHGESQDIFSSFNALKIITSEHERAHAGRLFHHSDVTSLAAAGSNVMLFSVSSDMPLHVRNISFESNVGPCEGYLYKDPFIDVNSLGVGFRPTNLRHESSYTGASSFYHAPFIDANSMGTQMDASAIVSATGGPVKTIQGEASNAVTEHILARGSNYVFKFTNNNGSTALIVSNTLMYEPVGSD